MPTLHIEHPITNYETWSSAFGRFADVRRQAGVRTETIRRPVDDPKYVVIDLGFDTTDGARAFLSFLKTKVWAIRGNAPALVGDPRTMILEPTAPE